MGRTLVYAYSKKVSVGLAAFLSVVLMFSAFSFVRAQNATSFTSADRFPIPELNGIVSFTVNGSYSVATLENSTWSFKDLRLEASQSVSSLKVSAENSTIAISYYQAFNSSFGRSSMLRYTVEGQGKQSFNFNLNSSEIFSPSEWSVISPNSVFLAEGEGWNLLPDNTVVVTGATGNVTIVHYGLSFPNDSNLPFFQQHSVAIITVIVLLITVVIAVVIRVRVRR
jgi:hypothetical protein